MNPRLDGRPWTARGLAVVIAALWGFHAGAFSYPGRVYFSIVGLNDISRPLGPNVLLHPAFLCSVVIAVLTFRAAHTPGAPKCGIGLALGFWLVGATLSTVANIQIDQVLLTYFSVCLSAACVYLTLSRIPLSPAQFDIVLLGLVAGSLFPLVGGLQAFLQEWGVPDTATAMSAYQNLLRMQLYEAATFGNRGNTAGFIVIIAPVLLWVALDNTRGKTVRAAALATLVPIVLNLVILEVRAAFITLVLSVCAIAGFKIGIRRYPLFLVGLILVLIAQWRYSPDVLLTLNDRLQPVITANPDEDASVMDRFDSIREGVSMARKNWAFGIGPGGALSQHSQTSAHQFQVQQFMELGIFGLVGATLFLASVLTMLARTLSRGQDGGLNNVRFTLVIGPVSFAVYGLLANVTFNVGYVNTWAVLVASMLALAPAFEPRKRRLPAAALMPSRTNRWPVLQARADIRLTPSR